MIAIITPITTNVKRNFGRCANDSINDFFLLMFLILDILGVDKLPFLFRDTHQQS
jgi:hypothetical protein